MVHLNLSNVTAAIAAAGSIFNIVDFQGNCVDSPGGQTEDFTGVETYTCVPGAVNQQWSLTMGGNAPITLAKTPTAVLSTPLVGAADPPFGLIYQQAALRTNSIMTWQVLPSKILPGKYNIVSGISIPTQQVAALTAWAKRANSSGLGDSPSGALTLTEWNQNDVQQAFTLQLPS